MMERFEPALADLESHHIEGFVKHTGAVLKVPLYTEVALNLYMGGCPVDTAPSWADTIVNLYPWQEYGIGEGQTIIQHAMMDSPETQAPEVLHRLADIVNVGRLYGRVLVHCQAGLNRSGLIVALALFKTAQYHQNMAGAIKHLRDKRSESVLCNTAFEKWLLDQDKRIVLPTK